ncbi:MAG: hypothetical protein GXP62_03460 [Oligoflexia bacterium]|nr:hypothetical protein [Oligoflexia bacterium]
MTPALPVILGLVLGSCDTPPKATLPDPVHQTVRSTGRMVRAGAVQGYVARPLASGTDRTGTLILAEQVDDPTMAAAIELANEGGVALVVSPATDTAAARSYLAGMPDVRQITVLCQRASCP